MNAFNQKLQSYIDTLDVKKRTKYTIKDVTYGKIMKVLKSEICDESAKFKFWARQNFSLVQIGSEQFVYNKVSNLPVITYESMYEKILDCHLVVGHSGREKTWAEVV